MEGNPEDYYEKVVSGYRRADVKEIIQEFFIDTEPDGEQPKHSRILRTEAAEGAVTEFFAKLLTSVSRNANKEWDGKNLFAHDKLEQPLGWDSDREL